MRILSLDETLLEDKGGVWEVDVPPPLQSVESSSIALY